MTTEQDDKFEALLEYLKRNRGFDFSGYKRSSLMRRVTKRMQLVNLDDYVEYVDYLEVHPEEFAQLFNTILINVTSFFRDQATWDYLAAEILPRILKDKEPEEPIRIWSAGCATGEEAYSLAIIFAEGLGTDSFQKRVKIYASDVDQDALLAARSASYTPAQLEAVPEALREKYFGLTGDRHVFRSDLRRSIIFGRHDLVQDAPISRLDLLACRNTLMYFNAETQGRILARFHFALNDQGFLFLGKAEMLLTHANLFQPTELKYRIFVKTPKVNLRDRLLVMAQAGDLEAATHLSRHMRLRESAFDAALVAQLVVDTAGTVALANSRCRNLFGIEAKDIGRPFQDLEISYRPVELRSLIEKVRVQRAPVKLNNIERRLASGEVQRFDIEVSPLLANGDTLLGVSVTFQDVTRFQRLQEDLQRSNQELETANEELQSAHEELETTNEELQSTNEELETTNEELQSTNEELETMNEELQSTNEELETINGELKQRTGESDNANSFLQSILTSLRAGVVVVDRQFRILIWNHHAQELWGLREEEVRGKSLLELDIGLPVQQLQGPVRNTLNGQEDHERIILDAVNRRGKSIQCHLTLMPLQPRATGESVPGAVLLMDGTESAT